jgi:hypothetical protein
MSKQIEEHGSQGSILNQFIVLGRFDAFLMSLSLGLVVLADYQPDGTTAERNILIFVFAAIAVGAGVNGIRRAVSVRRHREAIDRAKSRLAEFDRIEAEDTAPPST